MKFLIAFIRFSRPHTVIGTTLSITVLYLLAFALSDRNAPDTGLLLLTLASCLGANIYIVGLNQITDVAIDRINKPYLPLASGAFSLRTGYAIVLISVLISLGIALYLGRFLLLTVLLSLVLGTAYSLPPFRLKRFHFWAAFCIIAVRGLIVNLLLFLHFYDHFSGEQHIPLLIWLLTGAIFVYSIVIAWFKDIPDMEGDRRFQINTLTLRLGARTVFRAGNLLVAVVFLLLALAPLLVSLPVHTLVFSLGHLLLLAALLIGATRTRTGHQPSMRRFYQFIWVLFFLEYLTFTAATL